MRSYDRVNFADGLFKRSDKQNYRVVYGPCCDGRAQIARFGRHLVNCPLYLPAIAKTLFDEFCELRILHQAAP